MMEEFGACVFDVSLDCEDGAPVGKEQAHAHMVVALANQSFNCHAAVKPRIAARVHPVDHDAFESDVAIIVGGAGLSLCHLMIPKVESVADVDRAVAAVDRAANQAAGHATRSNPLPLHVLIESPGAVHRAFEIASHPRVQSLSFGMMDFVSAHGGAIPASAMASDAATLVNRSATGSAAGLGQFSHPLIARAKLEIASACHAFGKVPSHCVVTEFTDQATMKTAAVKASREFGFTRMWSIHPNQIRPILEAFAPSASDVDEAAVIVLAAQQANWAPIKIEGRLHDRASYRYYWQVLERAHQSGRALPPRARSYFASNSH